MINKEFSLGVGLSSHQGTKFYSDGIRKDASFDSSTGPRFEFAYRRLGLTYTIMDYKAPSAEVYLANVYGMIYT